MTDEYYTAVTSFNLTWPEPVMLGRNGLTYSFADAVLKAKMQRDYDAAVVSFEKKYGDGDWRAALKQVKPLVSGYANRTWRIQ
ncbi:MAG: hypothetical protein KGN84_22310 [Acidobacteriota bacterium]|nr:hypothetical protein [Acidobacteriota bacterium]